MIITISYIEIVFLICEGILKKSDTTFYDYNLLPDHEYTYKVYLAKSESTKYVSTAITVRTNNYVWQSMEFENRYSLRLKLYDSYLYVCAGIFGLWRRDIQNTGLDWEYMGMADTSMWPYTDRGVQEVLVYSQNPDWILVYFQPIGGDQHAIFRSLDGGSTWSPADSGMDLTYGGYKYPGRLHRFLKYPDRIIGADGGVWYTFNFGEFWQYDESQFGAGQVYAFERHPINHNTIWLGGEGFAFDPRLGFSTDAGHTWSKIDLQKVVPYDNAVYSIAFGLHNPNIVYVGMQGAIIKTTDCGQTWISPLVTHPQGWAFRSILADKRNSAHLWAAAGSDIMETWDNGNTWNTLDISIPVNSGIIDMTWDDKEEVIYLATVIDGVYSLKP